LSWFALAYVLVGTVVVALINTYLLSHYNFTTWVMVVAMVVIFCIFIYAIIHAEPHEKNGMILCLILLLETIIYFVLYYQMPTSLTLFALRNVQLSILGIPMHPATFQALDAFWLMVFSPILAIIYYRLASKNRDLSMPAKYALGMFVVAISFLVLPVGAMFANAQGKISGEWLLLSYGLQALGELLVSALGFAMIARYVPQRLMGYTMGIWLLCTALGGLVGGKVASLASVPQHIKDPFKSLAIYSHLFLYLGLVVLVISIVMMCLVPFLKRLIPEKLQD
jgi:proton-dependent oligopeptide transporter, POT family